MLASTSNDDVCVPGVNVKTRIYIFYIRPGQGVTATVTMRASHSNQTRDMTCLSVTYRPGCHMRYRSSKPTHMATVDTDGQPQSTSVTRIATYEKPLIGHGETPCEVKAKRGAEQGTDLDCAPSEVVMTMRYRSPHSTRVMHMDQTDSPLKNPSDAGGSFKRWKADWR